MSLLKAALGFVATAYMNDAVVKPRSVGKLARSYCDQAQKPLLLIRGERIVDLLVGEPVRADVTQRTAYPIRCGDKRFGAVVAINALETLKRPDLALREWRRVADKVFVVLPSWWSPQAWLDPSHRWLIHPDMTKVAPLWTGERSVYLLPVSDRRYGRRSWSPTKQRLTKPKSTKLRREMTETTPAQSQSKPHLTEMYQDTQPVLTPDLPDMSEVISSNPQSSAMGTKSSASSTSPRALTVVSTQEFTDG